MCAQLKFSLFLSQSGLSSVTWEKRVLGVSSQPATKVVTITIWMNTATDCGMNDWIELLCQQSAAALDFAATASHGSILAKLSMLCLTCASVACETSVVSVLFSFWFCCVLKRKRNSKWRKHHLRLLFMSECLSLCECVTTGPVWTVCERVPYTLKKYTIYWMWIEKNGSKIRKTFKKIKHFFLLLKNIFQILLNAIKSTSVKIIKNIFWCPLIHCCWIGDELHNFFVVKAFLCFWVCVCLCFWRGPFFTNCF